MKSWFNRNATHIAIVGIFIAIAFLYFPEAFQGKVLYQNDVLQAQAGQKEILDIKERDGDLPLWTNSMFSGMPSYQVLVELPSNIGTYIMRGYKGVFPHPIDVLLLHLLGAYLLFNVLRVRPWLAAVGALAFAFTSYNFIYIEAGHANKTYALAFMAPIIAGVLLALRGRYLVGGVMLAFAFALQLRVNHVQVTYYLFLALLVLVIIELYHAIKEKRMVAFAKSALAMGAAIVIAVAVNASLLWPTYEYSKETIRGPSNLASGSADRADEGLSKQYAYDWSQGIGETLTFLVPNAYGGGSSPVLDSESNMAQVFVNRGATPQQAVEMLRGLRMPTYWGDKAFTSGPWYFGAIVVFFFILGLVLVKGRVKWWLASATVLLVLLSFGRHFPFVSDLFFDYFPLYNKFRAVESILMVVMLLVPILAVLAVHEIVTNRSNIPNLDKKLLYTLYGVGGFLLLVAIVPGLFLSFKTSDHQQIAQALGQQAQDPAFGSELMRALVDDRADMARMDALRSLVFILIGFAAVWLFAKDKLRAQPAVIILGLAILVDLWAVDKRYLNSENFVDKAQLSRQFVAEREVDQLIRMDTDPNYRVLDLTTSPFMDARTSYFHKSLGGYHAAKLMRYQELIERQLAGGAINEDVLDMLNTRYLITTGSGQDAGNQRIARRNTAAGNAWFVERVTFVESNEEEMEALNSFDARREAFVHTDFKGLLNEQRLGTAETGSIELVSYRPDHLVYDYSTPNDALAVFSEIWYDKGWKAYVDGKELPIVRANYVLRAVQLPGGNHQVELKFEPRSYHMGETISLIASIILLLGLGAVIWIEARRKDEGQAGQGVKKG